MLDSSDVVFHGLPLSGQGPALTCNAHGNLCTTVGVVPLGLDRHGSVRRLDPEPELLAPLPDGSGAAREVTVVFNLAVHSYAPLMQAEDVHHLITF